MGGRFTENYKLKMEESMWQIVAYTEMEVYLLPIIKNWRLRMGDFRFSENDSSCLKPFLLV